MVKLFSIGRLTIKQFDKSNNWIFVVDASDISLVRKSNLEIKGSNFHP